MPRTEPIITDMLNAYVHEDAETLAAAGHAGGQAADGRGLALDGSGLLGSLGAERVDRVRRGRRMRALGPWSSVGLVAGASLGKRSV